MSTQVDYLVEKPTTVPGRVPQTIREINQRDALDSWMMGEGRPNKRALLGKIAAIVVSVLQS